ncbi:prenyltransferase and squalene oxidase repeat-containing domain protein [Cooperia oncophora]
MPPPSEFRTCREEFRCNDDGFFSFTSTEQKRVEDLVEDQMKGCATTEEGDAPVTPVLQRSLHVDYLTKSLRECGRGYSGLDASRSWMCYWGLHSLNILGVSLPHNQKADILAFLKTCQHPDGGFGGGPGQYAHLAPTYASVMALASLQTEDALAAINLESLSRFLHRMKQPDGSFTMHDGGEADIRGTYCALAVAALCGIMTDKLKDGAAEWVIKCQTYEGGFGGEPFAEAHGGIVLADSELLLQWLSKRQMRFEGGFQGRTNKLVDGCYSFWQAANFPLIDGEMAREGRLPTEGLFDARMLEEYILLCCQDEAGGFRDKPDKSRDLYHTCYVLSGLAVAQAYSSTREPDGVLGGAQNVVVPINPVFNLTTLSEQFADFDRTNVKEPKSNELPVARDSGSSGKKHKANGLKQPLINEIIDDPIKDTLGTADLLALEEEADEFLKADIDLYNQHVRTQGGSEASWLLSVIKKGTASDRMTAMQLQMHTSPVHSLCYMEIMIGSLERKKHQRGTGNSADLASLVVEDLSKRALRTALNLLAERPEGERFLLSMLG